MGDDETLMRRIASGERAAFAALMERHLSRALAERVTGNLGDAEKLVQEAMLKVWTQAERFRPERQLLTLILCYWDDQSNQEAAATLGTSVAAIETLLGTGTPADQKQVGAGVVGARERNMTPERLRRILETHGGEPTHWPAGERQAAEALAGRLPQARAWLNEARRLDRLLDGWSVAPAPTALAASILAATARSPRNPSLLAWLSGLWPRPLRLATLGGLACVAAFGFALSLNSPADPGQEPGDLMRLLLDIDEEGYSL